MFIFFDREKILDISVDNDSKIQWDRWKRNVIDAQAKTCHGAERYIKNGGNLFLDPECLIPLPIKYDSKEIIIHKVIIANGASDACVDFSDENINGSLGITYRNIESHDGFEFPFLIDIDKNNKSYIELASDYYLLASVYSKQENYALAITHLTNAITYDRQAENGSGLGSDYLALGTVYEKAGNIELARVHYKKALDIYTAGRFTDKIDEVSKRIATMQ